MPNEENTLQAAEVDSLVSLLSAIVDSSDDAIVSKTLEGIVTSWNPAAERMFGYAASEAIGKSIRLIIPAERQAEEDYVLNEIRKGRKVDHYETIRQTKDGRRLSISLTVSPVRNASGVVIGASKIARDITMQKQVEHDREIAHHQLAEAVAARDEFIAIAAHELRSPLAVLALLWEMAAERPRNGAFDAKLIEKSRKQLQRLTSLVDRLLDVARVRSGTFDVDREEFELRGMVQEVANRFAFEDSGLSLDQHIDPGLKVRWDRLRIDEALTNLISNAIKFGAGKPIMLRAVLDAGQALISVQDHGVGIAPEDLDRIFDRFERADLTGINQKGLGIGLWLTKRIVEAHGGTIQVDSAPGHGSTFILRLPFGPPRINQST